MRMVTFYFRFFQNFAKFLPKYDQLYQKASTCEKCLSPLCWTLNCQKTTKNNVASPEKRLEVLCKSGHESATVRHTMRGGLPREQGENLVVR